MMGLCPMINVLMELKLEVNGLNGSISDPAFEQSIAQLHACGLISLELAGNALSGTFSNYWGEFRNLWALNVGEACNCGSSLSMHELVLSCVQTFRSSVLATTLHI